MERVSHGAQARPCPHRVPPVPHELLHPHWWVGSAALGIFFFFFESQEGVKLKMLKVSSHVKNPMSLIF